MANKEMPEETYKKAYDYARAAKELVNRAHALILTRADKLETLRALDRAVELLESSVGMLGNRLSRAKKGEEK